MAEAETHSMTVHGYLDRTVYRPFKMLATEPILLLVTLWLTLLYGLVYARERFHHPTTPM